MSSQNVTAGRLGSAPIRLDWTRLGVQTDGAKRTQAPQWEAAWNKLRARFQTGEVGFFDAPVRPELSQLEPSVRLAREVIARNQFTDCLILGIGGSALGPISLLSALQEKANSGIRVRVMENPDPIEWKSTLAPLNPDQTLVVCVAKSGTTFETLAQWLLALDWLGKPRWKTHTVAITDPTKGDLRRFATAEQIPTLAIAPAMGGRFTVFTPVGLFVAELAGLQASELIAGAGLVRDFIEKTPAAKNPLFIIGAELLAAYPKINAHVCMPYSSRLRAVGDWFVQLWGESLGKDGKGFTPLAALGAVDQHSILQLLRDGPNDKATFFIGVDRVDDPVRIPRGPRDGGGRPYPAFEILEGATLHDLLAIEMRAIERVLANQKRPSLTIHVDRLDEKNLGALYFAFCVLTAFTGTLWDVNPFDQPGVEEGKIYIRESLESRQEEQRAAAEEDAHSAVSRLRRQE